MKNKDNLVCIFCKEKIKERCECDKMEAALNNLVNHYVDLCKNEKTVDLNKGVIKWHR